MMADESDLVKQIDDAGFAKLISDKRYTYYVSMINRPGMMALSALVEYRIFHPRVGPESNDDFQSIVVNFEKIRFWVFAVPYRFESQVADLAEAIDMRISKGYPSLIVPNGMVSFPGHREAEQGRYNLYSVVNTPGNQIYLNRRDLTEAVLQRQTQIINLLLRFGTQIPLEAIRDELWGLRTPGQMPS
jgi:hypothetical protein